MSLAGVAKETLAICERGEYAIHGARVVLRHLVEAAIEGPVRCVG